MYSEKEIYEIIKIIKSIQMNFSPHHFEKEFKFQLREKGLMEKQKSALEKARELYAEGIISFDDKSTAFRKLGLACKEYEQTIAELQEKLKEKIK